MKLISDTEKHSQTIREISDKALKTSQDIASSETFKSSLNISKIIIIEMLKGLKQSFLNLPILSQTSFGAFFFIFIVNVIGGLHNPWLALLGLLCFIYGVYALPLINKVVIGVLFFSWIYAPWYASLPLTAAIFYFLYFRKVAFKKRELNDLGDARWATSEDLIIGNGTKKDPQPLFLSLLSGLPTNPSGIFLLGKHTTGKKTPSTDFITMSGEGHALTVASTGSGKGVNVVIPNILHYEHSIVVLDPKGENFLKTHSFREKFKGQEICLLDPFGEVKKEIEKKIQILKSLEVSPSILQAVTFFEQLLPKVETYGDYLKGFNPMTVIEELLEKEKYDQILDEADIIADMLIVKDPQDKEPHWNEKAKSFIRGMILFTALSDVCNEDRERYPLNLITVKKMLGDIFGSTERTQAFIELCEANEYLEGVAHTVKLIADQERSSVLSTVMRHFDFLNSTNAHPSITRKDFRLDDIRMNPKTIYLVLPANKITSYNRLARLWIASVKSTLERVNDIHRESRPVLFMLDEVAQLGRMEPLKNIATLGRSYGMKLWMIFQDLAQMKTTYPNDEWRTFISNTKVHQFFGVSPAEIDTCEYVSKASGQQTISVINMGASEGRSESQSYGTSSSYGGSSSAQGGSSNWSTGSNSGNSSGRNESLSANQQIQARPLLTLDQVPRITKDHILVFGVTKYPIKADKMPYYDQPMFDNRFPFQLENQVRELVQL